MINPLSKLINSESLVKIKSLRLKVGNILPIASGNHRTEVIGSVVSINQQGGQTAQTIINSTPPKRMINANQLDVLRAILDGEPALRCRICLGSGDPEAEAFARSIEDTFNQLGWQNIQFMYKLVEQYPKGVSIQVGEVNKTTQGIANWLHQIGLSPKASKVDKLKDYDVSILIGPNPN